MRIAVIGGSDRIRSRIVASLRKKGHEAEAVEGRRDLDAFADAPCDPGLAGRPLRTLLKNVGGTLRNLWLDLRRHRAGAIQRQMTTGPGSEQQLRRVGGRLGPAKDVPGSERDPTTNPNQGELT